MPSWTLNLLGTCELLGPDGGAVSLSTRKSLAMLVFLALQPERRARRQRLLALLWEDVAQEQGRLNVRKALWIVRSATSKAAPLAEPPVASDGEWILVPDGAIASDVDAFLESVRAAGDDIDALDAACARYKGDLLGDFDLRNAPAFDDWAAGERQRVREAAIAAMRRLLDLMLEESGRTEAAMRVTLRLLGIDPLQEDAHRALMRLHVRQGRPAAALSHFHTLRDMLRRDLAVDPEPQTQALFREIGAGRRAERRHDPAVERASAGPVTEPDALPAAKAVGPDRRIWILAALLVLLAILAGAAALWMRPPAPEVQRVFPINANLVMSGRPALSPDGSRLVFTGRAAGSDNVDLYLMTIGDPEPQRLTDDRAIDDNGAWSPDATSIAFVRVAPDGRSPCRIFIKTVPSGSERLVGRCTTSKNSSLAWSADGAKLFLSDQAGPDSPHRIVLLDIASGRMRPLTSPPGASFGDRDPQPSGDGRSLAFLRDSAGRASDLYLLDLSSGRLKTLTAEGGQMSGIAWSPGDRGLFYSSDRAGDAGLWWLPRRGGDPRRIAAGLLDYRGLATADDRPLMVFEAIRDRSQLSILEGGSDPASTPAPVARLMTDARDMFPDVGQDGAIAFVSNRSGQEQLWVAPPGAAPRQLTELDGWRLSDPRWSPDGRRIAFVASRNGATDIYVIAREGGAPARLTEDSAEDSAPAWSPDGKRLYFSSRRDGRSRIWLLDPSDPQSAPKPVSPPGPGDLRIDPGGRWIYYLYPGQRGIWRRRLSPDGQRLVGAEQRLATDFAPLDWMNWAVSSDAIFYASRPAGLGAGTIKRVDAATGLTTEIGDAGTVHRQSSFAVTPDGRLIVPVRTIEIDLFGMEFQ